jgi:hypothetical protein
VHFHPAIPHFRKSIFLGFQGFARLSCQVLQVMLSVQRCWNGDIDRDKGSARRKTCLIAAARLRLTCIIYKVPVRTAQ